MRKETKIALIVAGSCILVGVIVASLGLTAGGLKQMRQSGGYYYDSDRQPSEEGAMTEKTFSAPAGEVRSVSIRDRNNDVEVRPSQDGQVRVDYGVNQYETYDVSTDGGVLTVSYRRLQEGAFLFGLHLARKTLVLYLPEGFAGDVEVDTSNGALTLEKLRLGGQGGFTTSNAPIRAKELSAAGGITAVTSNGDIVLEKVEALQTLSGVTSNASIRLTDASAGDIRLESSNGRIALEKVVSQKDIIVQTSNASIETHSCQAAEGFSLKTDNGAIRAQDVDAGQSVRLATSNDRIQAVLSGSNQDYTITSRTSNGRNSLPTSWKGGDKQLAVTNRNGDIDVTFAQ